MNFVLASTSGGGVGSIRPRSDKLGVYCLIVGVTGLFGSSARSFALRFPKPGLADGVARGAGDAVGSTRIGRGGPVSAFGPFPACGPGEPVPLGPGLGAVPGARAAANVGLGLGTPGEAVGAALARTAIAAAVGAALGTTGPGVAGFALGDAVGAGGLGEGRALGAEVGAGDGAAVASGLIATATGATVGTVTGAAGSSLRGCTS